MIIIAIINMKKHACPNFMSSKYAADFQLALNYSNDTYQ